MIYLKIIDLLAIALLLCCLYLPVAESNQNAIIINETNLTGKTILSYPVAWGYEPATNRTISAIVVHRSYDAAKGHDPHNFTGVVEQWEKYGVIPHYAIARDKTGTIYRFVNDSDIAYQAGNGTMDGNITNWNPDSVGVEIIYDSRVEGPSQAQYESLVWLLRKLTAEHKEIRLIVGHDTIAFWRGKTDPENFNWLAVFGAMPGWNLRNTTIRPDKYPPYQTTYMFS